MKRITAREANQSFSRILSEAEAGEEIVITRRGKPGARLVPESPEASTQVDWSQSAAVGRDRSHAPQLTAEETTSLIHEAGGRW